MTNRTNGYRQVKGFGSTATIWLLLIALWIAMGVHSGEAFGAEQLEYLDEKGNSAFIDDYTVLTESIDTIGDDDGKWYVVQGNLKPTSNAITVNGTAKLLLTNGCRLSAERISVTGGNRLEIYAQSTDVTQMGTLQCHQETLGGRVAAIGGNERESAGTIVIWGGHISAKAKRAAAIGGGAGQSSGKVAIKDGVVKASSNDSSTAVIGGAKEGRGGSVIIDGGDVDVTGGGTGIGAGRQSESAVSVSISAGTVTAQDDGNGYVAIGADQADGQKPGAGAKVAIGGGHVTAISSSEHSGIGIGSKKGASIRINGGTVEAKGKDAGVGAQVTEGTEITIGWKEKEYTAAYYADSVKGNVKFDPGDRFIYKVEPGNIYTGSKEVDPSSIDEKSTIIPYVYTVQYDKGVQGTGGTMPEHGANPNHDFYLPECDFTCADDYVFSKWKIGDKEYDAKEKVKFEGDTTVTATWKKVIPLKVSNIKANDKTFDGKKDATFDCSEAVLDGLAEGDSVTVSAEGSFANPFAGNDKDVFIEKITLQGDAREKYTINVDGSQKSAKASIKKRPLTITADDKSSKKGEALKELTYKVSDGYVQGDDLGITVSTDANKDKAGTYDIKVGWNNNKNYDAKLVKGKYTVTAEPTPPTPKVSKQPSVKIKAGKKSLTLGWIRINNADGYDIFFARCNHSHKKKVCRKVKNIKGNNIFTWKKSGLKKGTAYKSYVKAYIMKNGKKKYVYTSPVMHAYTGNGTKKYTNAKSVKLKNVKKGKLSLKKGKVFKLKAKVNKVSKKKKLMPKSHAPALRYITSDKKIATVSSKGKIKVKAKGKCTIYAYAHNGVSKKVTVIVK